MRARPLHLLAVCAVTLAACGGGDDGGGDRSSPQPQRATNEDEPCPAGTRELTVRDVLPNAPAGMAFLRVRERDAEQAAATFEAGFGDTVRSVRFAVIAPRGGNAGTGVGVLNLTVRADDESAPETTATRQALTIAGRPGQIVVAPGGNGARAVGSVGACGVVVLNGPDEASVRRVAAKLRQPD